MLALSPPRRLGGVVAVGAVCQGLPPRVLCYYKATATLMGVKMHQEVQVVLVVMMPRRSKLDLPSRPGPARLAGELIKLQPPHRLIITMVVVVCTDVPRLDHFDEGRALEEVSSQLIINHHHRLQMLVEMTMWGGEEEDTIAQHALKASWVATVHTM